MEEDNKRARNKMGVKTVGGEETKRDNNTQSISLLDHRVKILGAGLKKTQRTPLIYSSKSIPSLVWLGVTQAALLSTVTKEVVNNGSPHSSDYVNTANRWHQLQ